MKILKIKSGIFLFLALLLMIPKGFGATPINTTIFLNFGQMSSMYTMQVSKGDVVLWSFQTYNDSFNVAALGFGVGTIVSSGHTSDSGSVEALAAGPIVVYFTNMGPDSGYIDISIRIKEDAIEGYPYMILIVILFSIVSMISIKKKSISKRYAESDQ